MKWGGDRNYTLLLAMQVKPRMQVYYVYRWRKKIYVIVKKKKKKKKHKSEIGRAHV